MRAIVQRVNSASVIADGVLTGKIEKGLLVFLGVAPGDDKKDLQYMCDKILNLRIFCDDEDKMNLSLKDVMGELLVVSQFTLYGDCRKGRRPNFTGSCEPVKAEKMYEEFLDMCKSEGFCPQHGVFGADMKVKIENDGPVTIMLDSEKLF